MNNNHRRRKKRHTHGTKTVDVCRGKTGYGFTISGQQPCILSCIVAGSPADMVGLKMGDYLLHVNNLNVSKASHDEVVRLIGSSSGTLTLVIAENDNASDSSDDDFQARPKNKYPNRVRLRQYSGKTGTEKDGSAGFGRERSENIRGHQAGSIQQHQHKKHQQIGQPTIRSRALSPVVERYGRTGARTILHMERGTGVWLNHQQQQQLQSAPLNKGVENMDPLSVAVYPRRQKHASASSAPLRTPQGTKHTIITREMRMVKSLSHSDIMTNNQYQRPIPALTHTPITSIHQHTPIGIQKLAAPEIAVSASKGGGGVFASVRIIVGYVGSVEMPRDAHMPCSRHQSIRSAVRRLRVDNGVHTLVLMEIYLEGIRMTNKLGSIVALYAAERIAFSSTCPDDKRFFGIVTLHREHGAEEIGPHGDLLAGGSSCHVFMVDPEMAVHSVHVLKAKTFGIQCSLDPSTQLCLEFPQYASIAVKNISKLCRKSRDNIVNGGLGNMPSAPQQNGCGQPVMVLPQHRPPHSESNTNSSNSDSGFGYGREDQALNTDQVYVVEMTGHNTSHNVSAHNTSASQDSSLNWTAERSAFHPADASMYKSTGESDLSTMIPPSMRQIQSGASEPSMSSNVNTSLSSNDASFLSHGTGSGHNTSNAFDRLNLRVMPDPRGVNVSIRQPTPDVLDKQNSADNLRRSMHRYMQTQTKQRFLEHSDSEAESLRSNESINSGETNNAVLNASASGAASASSLLKKNPTRSQGVTAVDQSDPHKLSPRVFQAAPPQQPPPTPGTQYEFLVPAIPVLTKPPVPGRPPQLLPKSGSGIRTPMRDRVLPERPKSTPPFRGNMITPPPLATDEDYDTDPGSVMGTAAGDAEESWNGKVLDTPDDTQEDEEPDEPISARKTKKRKQKRRFSEGFFLKKLRQKENVENSRLAKGGSFKQIKRRPNLSTSHESLVVSDGVDFTKKLNGAPSATSIQHASPGVANTSVDQIGPSPHGQRSARWAIGFDRLLDDCAGLETFTEFLKKELSQENIEFWLKCENYKQLSNEVERQKEARYIWKDHLAPFASDSVNVDSATLAGIEDGLDMAPNALFDAPQTHILQLMKQDSYPRFLKSDLYKQCVVAEMEGKPVPYLGTSHNPRRREEKKPISKSKSSVSVDKGGKRRGSFFTFSWKSKSEKRLIKSTIDGSEPPRWSHKNEDGTDDGGKEENSKEFCRVILPDGSTTVFHAKPGTPIKLTIQHLCQRRNLSLAALEVFQQGVDKPLDLTKDVATLASKLIWVELRVLFQVDLPSRRSLVVRAKPELTLRDALKPILPSYNLKVDNMVVHMVGSDAALDLDGSVTKLEGQRLTVQTEEDFAEWGFNLNNHRGKPPVPSRSKSTVSLDSTCDDEHLVRDVADGKLDVAHLFDENGVYDPDKKHDKCRNEEGRTSGLFGFIRRNSAGEKDSSRLKSKHGQPATVSGVEMDRPRPRVRPPIKDKEAENLFEQLNKLSGRLDDQRGDQRGLRGDLELPDFLKVDKPPGSTLPTTGKGDTPSTRGSFRTRERRSSDSSILDVETSRRLSQSQDDMNFNGFGRMSTVSPSLSNRIPFIDHSFSQDGVVPTHAQADEAFVTARHYPGSPDLNMVWVSSTSMADGPSATRPPVRLRYSPRSRTPDARRTLLQESNGYAHRNGEVDEDLSVQPLLDGSAQSDNGSLHMDIAAYSPKPGNRKPIPSARKVPPQPPPRKTLTTPKKFLPSPTGGGQQSAMAQSPRHSQQNSTSSDLSHHSDSTIATTHSGSSGGNIRASASSTPSPTTHDLCLGADSSQESTADAMSPARRTCPQPPPRPSRRSHVGSSGGSSADEGGRHQVQKTLNFEQKESITKQNDNDMPVSYV